MAGSSIQRGDSRATTAPQTSVAEILDILSRHHPGLSKSALRTTGRAMAALAAATRGLSPAQQRNIVAHEKDLTKAMAAVVADLSGRVGKELITMTVEKPVEVSVGAGLANALTMDEGQRRIAGYATPTRLEDWAGPVAGPGEIERAFGTKRSTLHDWQRRGAVIGLLKGERKHVFPLTQFVDGRPVEGMAEVTKIIGNPRVAWQWLIQPKPALGASPLDCLKNGGLDEVLSAAAHDFG